MSDAEVRDWVAGLPSCPEEIVIVSLLGSKDHGLSEFSYYSFRSVLEKPEDRPGCPTFQEWLDLNSAPGRYQVCEYATTDMIAIPDEIKSQAVEAVCSFLAAGKTVIIVDSGGYSRTGEIVRGVGSRLKVRFSEEQLTAGCP